MTYSYTETTSGTDTSRSDETYAYSISTASPWFGVVAQYALGTGEGATQFSATSLLSEYVGNGLTMKQAEGDPTTYTVVGESTSADGAKTTLSAAAFAAYLLKKVTNVSVTDNSVSASINGASVTEGWEGFTSDNGTMKASGLALGYYLVFGIEAQTAGDTTTYTTQALAELNSTTPDVEITDKNVGPTVDKKQTDTTDNSGSPADYTDYALDTQIGDTVYYQITGNVPDVTGYTKYDYIVTDTLTKGLTLKTKTADSSTLLDVTIRVNGQEQTIGWTVEPVYGVYEEGKDTPTLEQTKDGSTTPDTSVNGLLVGFKVSVDLAVTSYERGLPIEITYSAVVNENAVSGVETNTASLTYSNDPNNTDSKDTVTDETEVYNAKIKVFKYTAGTDATKKALAGAQFVLYRTVDGANQYYYYDSTAKEVKWNALGTGETLQTVLETATQDKITALTTDESGALSGALTAFVGLEEGTYYLLETEAPDGYNLLTDPVTVDLTQIALSNETNKTTDPAQLLAVGTNTTDSATTEITIDTTRLDVSEEVENKAGSILPSTGGMGTTIFYIIGGVLVIGAAVLLITRRRMNRE